MKCEHEVLCGIENCTKKDEECREMLIQKLIERKKEMEQQKIVFLCDKHACDKCSNSECEHTENIRHAKNFESFGDMFVEKN